MYGESCSTSSECVSWVVSCKKDAQCCWLIVYMYVHVHIYMYTESSFVCTLRYIIILLSQTRNNGKKIFIYICSMHTFEGTSLNYNTAEFTIHSHVFTSSNISIASFNFSANISLV